jgi:hypothetical protein
MAQYVLTYFGGNQPSTPEEGKKHFAKYQEWLAAFADCMVSPANPLKDTHTVHPDQSVTAAGTKAMSGYTIIEVQSMERALEIAKACPFLDIGGSLEVSELIKMDF